MQSKAISNLIFQLNQHYTEQLKRLCVLFENDLLAYLIFNEILVHGLEKTIQKSVTTYTKNLDQESITCNPHSISLRLNIPRETVRRKLKKLENLKLIYKNKERQYEVSKDKDKFFEDFRKETLEVFLEFYKKVKKELSI